MKYLRWNIVLMHQFEEERWVLSGGQAKTSVNVLAGRGCVVIERANLERELHAVMIATFRQTQKSEEICEIVVAASYVSIMASIDDADSDGC
jgi:hypothetical protein